MGYWSIVIEGSGSHHNPDYEKDANRMADEFVKQLKAAGHEIKRAAFLYDYKGENAGDTLPYYAPKWPTEAKLVDTNVPGPYTVVRITGGPTPLFLVQGNGHTATWYVDEKPAVMFADRYNEAAAKTKPVSPDAEITRQRRIAGGSGASETLRIEAFPEPGVLMRKFYRWEHEPEERMFEYRYDLDLGSDHYLQWMWGTLDGYEDLPWDERPRTEKPVGIFLYHRVVEVEGESHGGTGWCCGGLHFTPEAGAPKHNYSPAHQTWDVQSLAPLTITPSVACRHASGDDHGFITGGRWVQA